MDEIMEKQAELSIEGLNINSIYLFGEKFGDHSQSITLRIGCAL